MLVVAKDVVGEVLRRLLEYIKERSIMVSLFPILLLLYIYTYVAHTEGTAQPIHKLTYLLYPSFLSFSLSLYNRTRPIDPSLNREANASPKLALDRRVRAAEGRECSYSAGESTM